MAKGDSAGDGRGAPPCPRHSRSSEHLADAHAVAVGARASSAIVSIGYPADIADLATGVLGVRMVIRDPARLEGYGLAMASAMAPVPAVLEDPGVGVADPRELLLGYLDWYRAALLRKVEGLSDEQLRGVVEPLGWSPLGMIQHLGWVERRWLRWGFAAEQVQAYPAGGDAEEWGVPAAEPTERVIAAHTHEVERSRALTADAGLDEPARVGGRFASAEQVPSLGRILFHLLQEYARHLGQLDIARELIDGETGE